ncbi:Matrix metalloproteinase-24 [Apis cerana cerana]|uniref:Matrix metalloproteinase-24 n=1 Tax=Apis cerana cerana TaxID=94128 RepID=A0A2A3EG04_APICC|nr:Matrix metalloproteinase-24 [Apis cerana cerana]
MKKYGYLESGVANSDALYQKTAITNAVKTLQKFGNIPITGQLDNTTLEKFSFEENYVVANGISTMWPS